MILLTDEIIPIDWAYNAVKTDMRPRYIAAIVILSIMLILYSYAMFICFYYLHRRRKGVIRHYRVNLNYLDNGENEEIYLTAYGKIDIYLYYHMLAKVKKIHRLKPSAVDKELEDGAEFYDVAEMSEMEKEQKNDRSK